MQNMILQKKPKIPPNDVFGHRSGVKNRHKILTISLLRKVRVEVGKEIISR
jgi:hypothetical protein